MTATLAASEIASAETLHRVLQHLARSGRIVITESPCRDCGGHFPDEGMRAHEEHNTNLDLPLGYCP